MILTSAVCAGASESSVNRLLQQPQPLLELAASIVSGASRRITFPYMPQERSSSPRSKAAATMADACSGACSASSNASIGPSPRTSPIASCLAATASRRARSVSPSAVACSRNPGSATASSTATAAAQESGLPPNVPPSPPGGHRVHDLAAARDAGERQAAADRLPRDEQVGLDAVEVLDRPHLPRPADAGLHLVVDVEDPVLAAELLQPRQVVGRHGEKPAFALHRLEHDAGDRSGIDIGLEEPLQARIASSLETPRYGFGTGAR